MTVDIFTAVNLEIVKAELRVESFVRDWWDGRSGEYAAAEAVACVYS